MRRVLLTVLLAHAFTVPTLAVSMIAVAPSAIAAAPPKHGYRPPLAHRYDFNQNGRVNTMERANARLMRSQQRDWNAARRNNAAVR